MRKRCKVECTEGKEIHTNLVPVIAPKADMARAAD